MKPSTIVFTLGMAILCGACASPKRFVVSEIVGPAPNQNATSAKNGILQVYSARQAADVDLNTEVFLWNNDFGKNDFMYNPAHTEYNIYGQNGKLLTQVSNAHTPDDRQPAKVSLPPGTYKVEAQAEVGNATTIKLVIPVAIRQGETTVVHLEPNWKPSRTLQENFVRAYDGRYIGWRVGVLSE